MLPFTVVEMIIMAAQNAVRAKENVESVAPEPVVDGSKIVACPIFL